MFYAQSSSAPSNFLTADNQQSWANNLARIIYSMNFDSLPTSSLCFSPRYRCSEIMRGSCRLGPGLAQAAGSHQDTLSTAGLARGLSSSRCLARVAFVLLVVWWDPDLGGQVGDVTRKTEESASQPPVQD